MRVSNANAGENPGPMPFFPRCLHMVGLEMMKVTAARSVQRPSFCVSFQRNLWPMPIVNSCPPISGLPFPLSRSLQDDNNVSEKKENLR